MNTQHNDPIELDEDEFIELEEADDSFNFTNDIDDLDEGAYEEDGI